MSWGRRWSEVLLGGDTPLLDLGHVYSGTWLGSLGWFGVDTLGKWDSV